jgi:hypothetical protein
LCNDGNFNISDHWLKMIKALTIASMVFLLPPLEAQNSRSLLGYGGLVVVPSADLARDATVTVGLARIPRLYGIALYPARKSVYSASLTFAPFFEVAFAVVKPDPLSDLPPHAGDRTVSVKLRFISEKRFMPALAVGAHDFLGVKRLGIRTVKTTPPENFAALYAVATKSYKIPMVYNLCVHMGYGTDWLPAEQNYLVGLFGGIELFVRKELAVMAEYDARYFNFGARLNLFSHFQFYLSWMDGKEPGCGLNCSYNLGDL